MKSSRSQAKPGRVIAEFGTDFLVREIVAEEDEPDDGAHFAIEDTDELGGVLAKADLRVIDSEAGEAEMDLKVGARPNDLAYQLTVNSIRDAVRAMLEEQRGVETVYFADTNLDSATLELVASRATNNVVEFVPREEATTPPMAMAA